MKTFQNNSSQLQTRSVYHSETYLHCLLGYLFYLLLRLFFHWIKINKLINFFILRKLKKNNNMKKFRRFLDFATLPVPRLLLLLRLSITIMITALMGIIMKGWRRTTLEITGNFEFLRHVLLKSTELSLYSVPRRIGNIFFMFINKYRHTTVCKGFSTERVTLRPLIRPEDTLRTLIRPESFD